MIFGPKDHLKPEGENIRKGVLLSTTLHFVGELSKLTPLYLINIGRSWKLKSTGMKNEKTEIHKCTYTAIYI